ncbi:MAG: hypothetical protein KDB92_08125, partial [Chitinophagaceae bacterium]|nr:hypothetical protein [Chitinophagaceae bacterium]
SIMATKELISITTFCESHEIELSFADAIRETGLVQFTKIENEFYMESEQVGDMEKYVHLYYDMDINVEGIETISHLLQKISALQEEMNYLKNKLRLLED